MNKFRPGLFRRILSLGWFCPALLGLWAICSRAADPSLSIAPPSSWVHPLAFHRLDRPEEANFGVDSRLLLYDRQIHAGSNETFIHLARELLTSEGVQNHSIISVNYDPLCQSLVLHWVKLWRGAKAVDRLDLSRVRLIQPERDLDEFLFTGEQSAVLALDDVRPGDILEYACSIRGKEPLNGGKFYDEIHTQWHEPADRLATRVVWPQSRHLYMKNHRTTMEPAVVKTNGCIEYTWDVRDAAKVADEPPLPVWYEPLPWVQLSEFGKWSEVNQWALRLFDRTLPFAPELARQIAEWRRIEEPEQRVLAVLRFVQDEVRYMGVENGSNAYAPSDPSVVFARRFGDCKDKTLLFVTVMRTLGVEAWPVLVSTVARQTLEDWQPTAAAFDHAIVEVTLDGQHYFLDPTAGFQRGPLAFRSWANYGCGLVVRPGTDGLSVIPESPNPPRTTVTEYFLVRVIGQPSDLKIATVAEGRDAEVLRCRFATTERASIAAQYLNSAAALYTEVEAAAPLEYQDDEASNQVMVTEYYRLGKFWSQNAPNAAVIYNIIARNIDQAVSKPRVSFRSMPLGLRYPLHQVYRADIAVPGPVTIQSGDMIVDNPAFRFHKAVRATYGRILAEEEYMSLSDAVPVEAVPDYLLQLDRVFDMLNVTFFAYY